MEFTNSPLVTYKKISPHKTSPRNDEIDTITIHCYVGQVTAQQGCDYLATTNREVSANYVVGFDGSIGLSVEEKDRSFCSSSRANDHRAITIEVACERTSPYAVTDAAYKALINLVADICKRNNIKELKWKNDKSLIGQVDKQNMTIHRWFSATACPGQYLLDRHFDIAEKVNAKIKPAPVAKPDVLYRVQVGAYSKKANALAQLSKVKKAGFDTYMVMVDNLYKIQVGAFSKKENADAMLKKVEKAGFDAFITTKGGKAVNTSSASVAVKKEIKVGSTVKVKKGAKTYDGKSLASFVYTRNHKVSEMSGDRVVITYNGAVVAAVKKSDLTLI